MLYRLTFNDTREICAVFFHTKDFHDLSSSVLLQDIRIFFFENFKWGYFQWIIQAIWSWHTYHILFVKFFNDYIWKKVIFQILVRIFARYIKMNIIASQNIFFIILTIFMIWPYHRKMRTYSFEIRYCKLTKNIFTRTRDKWINLIPFCGIRHRNVLPPSDTIISIIYMHWKETFITLQ